MVNEISLLDSILAELTKFGGGMASPPPLSTKVSGRFIEFLPEELRPLYGLACEKEKRVVDTELESRDNTDSVKRRIYLQALYEACSVRQLFRASVLRALWEYFRVEELEAMAAGLLDIEIRACWEVVLCDTQERMSLSLATG